MEVDRRLDEYTPIDTEAALDAEMRRIVMAGFEKQETLPGVYIQR